LINAGSSIADARSAFRDNSSDLKEQRTKLDGQLDRLIIDQIGLTGDFSQLTAKAGSIDYGLNKLSQKLDNALIGKYMQDKMKAVLNDKDTFCAAKNQCDGKGGAVTDKAIGKIFSGSSSKSLGSSSGGSSNGGSDSSAAGVKTKQ